MTETLTHNDLKNFFQLKKPDFGWGFIDLNDGDKDGTVEFIESGCEYWTGALIYTKDNNFLNNLIETAKKEENNDNGYSSFIASWNVTDGVLVCVADFDGNQDLSYRVTKMDNIEESFSFDEKSLDVVDLETEDKLPKNIKKFIKQLQK